MLASLKRLMVVVVLLLLLYTVTVMLRYIARSRRIQLGVRLLNTIVIVVGVVRRVAPSKVEAGTDSAVAPSTTDSPLAIPRPVWPARTVTQFRFAAAKHG